MPFLGMHVEEGVDGKRLKFLRDVLGARIWSLPLRLQPLHGQRTSVVAEKVVKLTQNAIFGRCCMNPDKFRNTNAYVDPAKFKRAVGKSSVTNFKFQINDSEGFLAFVETLKTNRSKVCMSVPTQVGARTLQLSKLMMEKAYYLHMRRLFPEAALHGHRLRQVQGPREGPERALGSGARQGHRGH